MIAVDTNIIVHAHRRDSPMHDLALKRLTELASGGLPWGIPAPCLAEFVRVVTHAGIYRPASTLAEAAAAIDDLVRAPTMRLLVPGPAFAELLTEDRGFSRYHGLRVRTLATPR